MTSNNILYIDIVNPYIKSPGSTDIMSESDKKTPTVSPDQGATSETATPIPKELESEWLQFLKQRKDDKEYSEMVSYYNKQAEEIEVPTLDPTVSDWYVR